MCSSYKKLKGEIIILFPHPNITPPGKVHNPLHYTPGEFNPAGFVKKSVNGICG